MYVCHSDEWNWTILACMFWPILAGGLLRRRETSAAPIAAVVVPLALSVALMWHGLFNAFRGMPRFGAQQFPWMAAGIADAFSVIDFGAFSALAVVIVTALCRHRPVLDRTTASLVAMILLGILAALAYSQWLAMGGAVRMSHGYFLIAAAIVSLLVAVAALGWTVLTGRGRISPRPIRYGVPAAALFLVVTYGLAWQSSQHYLDIVKQGWR